MRTAIGAAVLVLSLVSGASAQRPSDPALMAPHPGPELRAIAVINPLAVPAGMQLAPAGVAFDSRGHLFVLSRGPHAFFEFDADGRFVRAVGEGALTRAHGIHVDAEGNVWTADVTANVVLKFNPRGEVVMKLEGLNQPTDVAVARDGTIFVTQGHTPNGGDPRVVKFDHGGRRLATWGGPGAGPGTFQVAHGITIDTAGRLWVTDRENQRIQIFDQSGAFVREVRYRGLPCALAFTPDGAYMVNGYGAQLLRLDAAGAVVAVTGRSGTGRGEFAEAHDVAVSPAGEVYVADSTNAVLQKFVPTR
jgi:DNA-binding beta-propeller fold protein YncE